MISQVYILASSISLSISKMFLELSRIHILDPPPKKNVQNPSYSYVHILEMKWVQGREKSINAIRGVTSGAEKVLFFI